MEDVVKYKIWLSVLKISDKMKLELLKFFKNEKDLYENKNKIKNIQSKWAKEFQKNMDCLDITSIEKSILNKEYKITTYNDKDYPTNLKSIYNPPYCIFYRGNISLLNVRESIAIVGSRKCTVYGKESTKYICTELGKKCINIISGGALGIDTIAHKTCVTNKHYNVAVLGCGINVTYPVYNKALYDEIEKIGVIITEFLPNTKPYSFNFPKRNRIISGLSKGVVVIEAGEKSGSLITCNYALEQGKDVIAVPGSIFSPQSLGCNKIIQDGAYIFTTIENMLYNLAINYKKDKKLEFCGLKGKIIKLLEEKVMHIDEIINNMNVDTDIIHELLCELQFENEINMISGNYFAKIL
ncbi:DNA-processing protein DprA [Clostridium tarantellae]|uniref:DNA-protecting protein DprA n=1 Tax=Clostridium tarantellae TaxID=39493 RepID=A0A6I1MJ18_9CLOT|nr:DNA-processing protein DprA [Clostridium tarantellae]MPQ42398.1 DNA-protecting protein DprA [Clostridium tarantellae]